MQLFEGAACKFIHSSLQFFNLFKDHNQKSTYYVKVFFEYNFTVFTFIK